MKIKVTSLIAATAWFFPSIPCFAQSTQDAASSTGKICIAPLPEYAREADHDYPGGRAPREYSYDFSVQIDSEKPVPVPNDKPVLVTGLDVRSKHMVRIRDGEQTIESFWFSFSNRGSNELCLAYGPWYQTWSLDPPRPGAKWCKYDNGGK